tara:strand:- start:440 stop:1249 length:810 start_codon:yes stop_codon:yes gene_type:complete
MKELCLICNKEKFVYLGGICVDCKLNVKDNILFKNSKGREVLMKSYWYDSLSSGRVFRKYKINENYFKKWSRSMSYILGFLYADGGMGRKCDNIDLSLQERDKGHLYSILEYLQANIPIYRIETKQLSGRITISYGFTLCSKKVCKDLLELGLHPNKTFTIKFPKMPKQYMNHFIRGYFDGDGCISGKERNWQFSLVSSNLDFVTTIQNILKGFDINVNIYKVNNSFSLCSGARESLRKFYSFLYDDAGLHLIRKKVKFNEFMKIYGFM